MIMHACTHAYVHAYIHKHAHTCIYTQTTGHSPQKSIARPHTNTLPAARERGGAEEEEEPKGGGHGKKRKIAFYLENIEIRNIAIYLEIYNIAFLFRKKCIPLHENGMQDADFSTGFRIHMYMLYAYTIYI